MTPPARLAALALALAGAAGCSTTYYAAMEQLGWAQRDILVHRVQQAADSQDRATTQFTEALAQFRRIASPQAGGADAVYATLKTTYDDTARTADDVRARIAAVQSAGLALFHAWRGEIADTKDARLRSRSLARSRDTQQHYDRMLTAMQGAQASMTPVLGLLRRQVQQLPPTLTAAAAAEMQRALTELAGRVATVVAALERSSAEANYFVTQLERDL